VGGLLYEVLLPSFIAGITSYQVCSLLGIRYQFYPLDFAPTLSEAFILKIVLAGVFFGLCSVIFIQVLREGQRFAQRFGPSLPLRGVTGGAILVAMAYLFGAVSRHGPGDIQASLRGEEILSTPFSSRPSSPASPSTFGGSGGLVMPILFVGATAGSLFGNLMGPRPGHLRLRRLREPPGWGANTPIAPDPGGRILRRRHRPLCSHRLRGQFPHDRPPSVFPTQVLSFKKTSSVEVAIGEDLEHVHATFKRRDKSLTGILLKACGMMKRETRGAARAKGGPPWQAMGTET
jgi:hypothetical protein